MTQKKNINLMDITIYCTCKTFPPCNTKLLIALVHVLENQIPE